MKRHNKSFLWLVLLLICSTFAFTSCDRDDLNTDQYGNEISVNLYFLFLWDFFYNGTCIASNGDPYYQDTTDDDPYPSVFHSFTSLIKSNVFQSYSTTKSGACEYKFERSNIL